MYSFNFGKTEFVQLSKLVWKEKKNMYRKVASTNMRN